MVERQEKSAIRVNCYYDGFNLYHAIVALGDPKLKWLNVKRLSESFIRGGETLGKVHFFTAVPKWDIEKQKRHENFLKALQFTGVKIHPGRFQETEKYCWANERHCEFREEKHTDVAIAVKLIEDAHADSFDAAVLITADADQVPVVKYLARRFPEKPVRLMAPPGRFDQCQELRSLMSDPGEITRGMLVSFGLPRVVMWQGQIIASMPEAYRF